jgi:hypothetical protein
MSDSPYRLSFTTGGLLMQESAMVGELYLKNRDWHLTRDLVRSDNRLQVRTAAASLRISKEVVARLEHLDAQELECVVEGNRRYEFIREFAVEVLREYFFTLRQVLSLKDFDVFFNGKAMWHDELDSTKPSTQNKLRQNLFRMMREADLISPENLIQPAMLTPRLAGLLSPKGREAFLIYPIADADIARWQA